MHTALFSITDATKAKIVDYLQWLESYHLLSVVMILVVAYIVREFGTRILMRIIATTIRHDQYPTSTDRKKRIKTLQSLVKAVLHAVVWIFSLLLIIGEYKPDLATALIAGGLFSGNIYYLRKPIPRR
jgi:small-conductance mechanosensitive channel